MLWNLNFILTGLILEIFIVNDKNQSHSQRLKTFRTISSVRNFSNATTIMLQYHYHHELWSFELLAKSQEFLAYYGCLVSKLGRSWVLNIPTVNLHNQIT